jgi:hypothetical protein
MQTVDETYLEENGWHFGVLKHVKLLSFPDPSHAITFEATTYRLQDLLGNSTRVIGTFVYPGLHSDSLVPLVATYQWHSIEVNRKEYVAVIVISHPAPMLESNVLVSTTGEDRGRMVFQSELNLIRDEASDILFPDTIEDRAWISPAVTRIKDDPGTKNVT